MCFVLTSTTVCLKFCHASFLLDFSICVGNVCFYHLRLTFLSPSPSIQCWNDSWETSWIFIHHDEHDLFDEIVDHALLSLKSSFSRFHWEERRSFANNSAADSRFPFQNHHLTILGRGTAMYRKNWWLLYSVSVTNEIFFRENWWLFWWLLHIFGHKGLMTFFKNERFFHDFYIHFTYKRLMTFAFCDEKE